MTVQRQLDSALALSPRSGNRVPASAALTSMGQIAGVPLTDVHVDVDSKTHYALLERPPADSSCWLDCELVHHWTNIGIYVQRGRRFDSTPQGALVVSGGIQAKQRVNAGRTEDVGARHQSPASGVLGGESNQPASSTPA